MFFKQFGGSVTREWIQRYEQSENWHKGSFHNLEPTTLTIRFRDFPRVIYKQLASRSYQIPKHSLPIQPFDRTTFLLPLNKARIIWYGHSAILMRMDNKNILIDPMMGPDTTPIAPFASKRYSNNTLQIIDAFPDIDLILLTHDHYDHLDYASIQKLKHKTKKYFVALGVKRHLVSWGVASELITEFDWWDKRTLDNIQITFTPTQHFSGRGLRDRLKTLWGGWALKTADENIWFSGDGGYNKHFKEVGRRLGPFDFAFMECGQYNEDWRPVHLFPDEAVQAALDAGVKIAMPVHWGAFALSYQHTWSEPAEEFVKAAEKEQLAYSLPALGEPFQIDSIKHDKWWNAY